nr:hypothetical protein [Tanacetum cinerariifolium]
MKEKNSHEQLEEADFQNPDQTQEEQGSGDTTMAAVHGEQPPAPPILKSVNNEENAMVLHTSEEKVSKEKTSEKKALYDKPLTKKLKFLIPSSLSTVIPKPFTKDPVPPRDDRKVKAIASDKDQMKELISLMDEEAKAQMEEMKRKRMLEEYNHQITHRADELPITKISYKINYSKEATMRITKDNDLLNLTVDDKFKFKSLGFSERIKVHSLASKTKSKENDILLQNLIAKFMWVLTQAKKLGIPPPHELSNFGIQVDEKRKRSLEILKVVFVQQDVIVDGMHRNLVPPQEFVGSRGLVITEPEDRIFYYNGNFNLDFKRESEFHLATTSQLIKILDDF